MKHWLKVSFFFFHEELNATIGFNFFLKNMLKAPPPAPSHPLFSVDRV